MKKEMLINVLQPEECRIAIVEDGVLEELYVERASQESYVGNIYKGRIVNIEASIQAAFVDFGIGRNGFLHVSDVDPAYYKHLLSKEDLAAYEAELEREYGRAPGRSERSERTGRGGRDRVREGRSPQPQPMTSFLQPQSNVTPAPPDEDLAEEFAAGLTDDEPLAEELPDESGDAATEEVTTATERAERPSRPDAPADTPDDDRNRERVRAAIAPPGRDEENEGEGFATGIIDEAFPTAAAAVQSDAPAPTARPDTPETDDSDGFAVGILADDQPTASPEGSRAEDETAPASVADPARSRLSESSPMPAAASDVTVQAGGTRAAEDAPAGEGEAAAAGSGLVVGSGSGEAVAMLAQQPASPMPELIPTGQDRPEEVDTTETVDFSTETRDRRPEPDGSSPVGSEPPAEPDDREPKRRTRTRRARAKSEEATEAGDPPETAPDAKTKSRTRRGRKKAEGEADAADEGGEDKPKFMGGAERRTTADDDEPEIRPFFENGGGYDPDAPNDRFVTEAESASVPPYGIRDYAADPETAEEAEEEGRMIARELEQAGESRPFEERPVGEQPVAPLSGRGFNDDSEERRPGRSRAERERESGRGRGSRERERAGRGDGERGGRDTGSVRTASKSGRDRGLPKPPIEQIFKRGQEVIVQVIKEAVGTKGPTLSTYISIAGRYLVLMPSLNRVGVSRKIEDPEARRRLREIMAELNPPKGVGFIVRTAAIDRDARELRNDLAYLLRLWQVVVKRIKRVSAPVEIYRESDMITRTIRDIFTSDIDTIWVDEPNAFAHASEFLQIVMPRFASRIRYFESTEPLFYKYGIEEEIAKIHQKRIDMPLGGSLIIEQTEALVAIDVNSGNFRADNNAEETAFQMNLHAAKEIARQLRLRDLGGVIVNDFIDMKSEVHRRKVEDAFREALRRDRARTKILRISQFGLIEMTRQRIRPSLKRSLFTDCPYCGGNGFVKTSESMSIETMRLLQLAAHRAPSIASVQVSVHLDVAHYLLNKRRKDLAALEDRAKMQIQITGQPGVPPDTLHVRCFDHNGNEVRLLPPPAVPRTSGGKVPVGRSDRGGRGGDRERRFPPALE